MSVLDSKNIGKIPVTLAVGLFIDSVQENSGNIVIHLSSILLSFHTLSYDQHVVNWYKDEQYADDAPKIKLGGFPNAWG